MKVMPSTQHILCVLLWPTNSIGDTGRNKHGEGRKGRLQRGNLLNPEHSVSSCCQVHRTLALPTCHLMTCHSPQGKVGRGAGEEGKEEEEAIKTQLAARWELPSARAGPVAPVNRFQNH